MRISQGCGVVRMTPISEPMASAMTHAQSAVVKVHQVPSSSSCRYVWTPSGDVWKKMPQFQLYCTRGPRTTDDRQQATDDGNFRYRPCSAAPSSDSVYRGIAAVGRVGDHLLERGAHRHFEVDVLRRDRLEEPLL